MKKTLMMAAGLAATLAAAPAMAEGPTGYIGGSYNHASVDSDLGDTDGNGWGADGSLAIPTGPVVLVIDGAYSDSEDTDSVISGTGHVLFNAGGFMVGPFAGLSDADGVSSWAAGAEAQKSVNNLTFAAAAGYSQLEIDDVVDAELDIWGVDGEARLFIQDNFRIQGNLGWANLDADFGGGDTFTAGAGGEYQFAGTPITVFGDYAYRTLTIDDVDLETDVNVFRIGARFNFGNSLRARDAAGADFAGLSSLTNFLGLTSFSAEEEVEQGG